MLSIPKNPCPVGGLVRWMNGTWPIVNRSPHPVLGWLYVIHEKRHGDGLVIWANVSQEELVREMEKHARFRVGTHVRLGPMTSRTIVARKWNFITGTMCYKLEGGRPGRELVLDQEELLERIKAMEDVA